MNIFTFKGDPFININGKDYFIIRGYKKDWDNPVMLQVFGLTALRKEDLPSSSWDLLITGTGHDRVWTAWQKRYFSYNTEQELPELCFAGLTTGGSYFLWLRYLSEKFGIDMTLDELESLSLAFTRGEKESHYIDLLEDIGSSNAKAVLFKPRWGYDEEFALQILKGGS